MSTLHQTFSLAGALALVGCTLGLAGCPNGDDSGDTDTQTTEPNPWEPMLEDLPGVLLSVWGTSSSDVWVAGADGGDGPEVHHHDGSGWTALQTGVHADLWWVFGSSDDTVWFSGSEGTVLRHDRASGEFEALDTPTEATLYGTWGPSDDLIYSVGGFVGGHEDGAGVILVIEDNEVHRVEDLPVGISPDEMFFKVWGSSASDVYVIGDMGSVLYTDGSGTWTRTVLADSRLVTLSGSSGEDIVIVGGSTKGQIYQRSGAAWDDVSPSGTSPLNGVFVRPDGQAAAAGMTGTVLERYGEAWSPMPLPEELQDWHGVWIDDLGSVYTAGGDFMNLDEGTLYRYSEE